MPGDVFTSLLSFFQRDPVLVLFDVLDIAIVAFLVYRVLVLMRGTRAMQMGVGLALLFVAHQVALRIGLVTVWTLLDTVTTYLVLIVVVVFQNDIRRALTRFGKRPLLRFGSARETHVFEEVIKATTALAQKRVGALIVFERDASLDEFIEPGTELDAAVTKELLFSVFIPSYENPMHDGAVIIREGRIWQAGAFLPLAANPKLDRALGTRHRAALGISEETDAVVVVVSEERGAVSLCYHGNLVRDLEPTALREALFGFLQIRTKKEPARKTVPPVAEKRREPSESEGRRAAGVEPDDEPREPSVAPAEDES
jgi:diadenylate cyclase